MKTKMSSEEIKSSFENILADNIKNLDKIENVENMEYFEDQEIEGYPWWETWRKDKSTLEAESIEYGDKFHETKLDEDYDKYSERMAKLDVLKRKINNDVKKYKEEYAKRIKETLKETIDEVKLTVKYNIELIDKKIAELTHRRDVLLRDKEELGKSYKGENYEEFFYSKINSLLKKINELENDKRGLLNVERDLNIEDISKRIDLDINKDNTIKRKQRTWKRRKRQQRK